LTPSTRSHFPRELFVLASGILILSAVSYALALAGPYVDRHSPWKLTALNAAPLFLAGATIFLVSGRLLLTAIIEASAAFAIFHAHQRKLEELDLPLTFSDFQMIPQFLRSPALLFHFGGWPLLAGTIAVIALILASLRWEPAMFRRSTRLVALLLAPLPAAALLAGIPLKPRYEKLTFTPWLLSQSTRTNGLLASLVQESSRQTASIPEPDMALLAPYLAKGRAPSAAAPPPLPDIVIWLSESFFNPGRLNDLRGCDYVPNICELSRRFPHGELIVPTYGGMTIRTEFEVLTGIPMQRIRAHTYPYLSLGNRKINSIAWHLRRLGYQTTAIHTHNRTFWNRNIALPNLGFQHWLGKEDIGPAKTDGYYAKDAVLTDNVARLLDNADQPQLIFAISMEAHGPWGKQKLDTERLATIALPDKLKEPDKIKFKQYLYHLTEADRQLARMARYIAKRKKPTLLLFFGDHLPGLTRVYQELGFRNEKNPKEQTTDYIVVGNFQFEWPHQKLAAWQIATELLSQLELQGNSQFQIYQELYAESRQWSRPAPDCRDKPCAVLKSAQLYQLSYSPSNDH